MTFVAKIGGTNYSVANSTTTPVITLNVPTASASNRGALSSTDWSTFNGKQAALVSGTNIKTVNGTSLLGSGDVGTIGIGYGGTGQTTANAAFNALAPSQTGNSGKYLTTDGTNTSWATNPLGTVTSVAASVPSFLSVSGSPITTSGTLAITYSGTALPIANGGTNATSYTAPSGNVNGLVFYNGTSLATDATTVTDAGYDTVTDTLNCRQLQANNGIICNSTTISSSFSIPSGSSAMSTGPITIASGVTVTVPSGGKWVVL